MGNTDGKVGERRQRREGDSGEEAAGNSHKPRSGDEPKDAGEVKRPGRDAEPGGLRERASRAAGIGEEGGLRRDGTAPELAAHLPLCRRRLRARPAAAPPAAPTAPTAAGSASRPAGGEGAVRPTHGAAPGGSARPGPPGAPLLPRPRRAAAAATSRPGTRWCSPPGAATRASFLPLPSLPFTGRDM